MIQQCAGPGIHDIRYRNMGCDVGEADLNSKAFIGGESLRGVILYGEPCPVKPPDVISVGADPEVGILGSCIMT